MVEPLDNLKNKFLRVKFENLKFNALENPEDPDYNDSLYLLDTPISKWQNKHIRDWATFMKMEKFNRREDYLTEAIAVINRAN